MNKQKAALALTLALLFCAIPLAVQAEVVQKGGIRVHLDGALTPKALPRSGSRGVRVALETKISAPNKQKPPQLRQIKLEINSHGWIEAKGLARCTLAEIQPSTTQGALAACRDSLVGKGSFAAAVGLGRQAPFPAGGALYAFNGTYHGRPAILAHVYGTEPVPTSFTLAFLIKPSHGTFGTALIASLPDAGGAGYVTHLALDLGRSFKAGGKTRHYVNAGCPAPAGLGSALFPFARAVMSFRAGPTVTSTIQRTCRVG